MKHQIILIVFLLLTGNAFTQNESGIENRESTVFQQNGVTIPGTNFTFIPPAHFKMFHEGESFGFLHPGAMSSIQIKVVDDIPYIMMVASITEKSVKEQGARLIAREDVLTKDGKPATIFLLSYSISVPETEQVIHFERLMMLTGTYQTTIWIDANYPEEVRPLLYNVMLDSMLSIKY